jgi:hypothetical protein
VALPRAVLGDVHTGYAKASSSRRWRAGVVSDGYPWWSSVAHSLNSEVVVTVLKRKLTSVLVARLPETRVLVTLSETATQGERYDELERALTDQELDVIMVDGNPPGASSSLWSRPKIILIVTTGIITRRGQPIKAPAGWHYERVLIEHRVVGGVSSEHFAVHCWTRTGSKGSELQIRSNPSQDLRSVMKTGVFGRDAEPLSPSDQIGDRVIELRANVVSVGGLYPNLRKKPLSKVRTRFDDKRWCDRVPSMDELLLMWDVPETVSKGLAHEDKTYLESSVKVPLRVRRGVCASLAERLVEATQETVMNRPVVEKRLNDFEADPQERRLVHKRARILDVERSTLDTETKKGEEVVVETVNEGADRSEDEDGNQHLGSMETDPAFESKADRVIKAAKNDDAKVPEELWNGFLEAGLSDVVKARDWRAQLGVLRRFWLKQYKRMFYKSAIRWIKGIEAKGMVVSREALASIREGLYRVTQATWWEWRSGSTPFFWRWPEEFQERIRGGIELWISGRLKPWKRAQRGPRDPIKKSQVKRKLDKIRERGYVEAGYVESLISFFDVDKGSDDIRMVYDGSSSGLNDSLWAPWFPLPTLETLLRSVESGTYMSDNDVGEMFLNFMLHEDIRKLCGVDFTLYYPEELESSGLKVIWERWQRCAMGLRTSPYQAIQALLWVEELILGDRLEEKNVFRWNRLHLNLPGSDDYDPTKSWVRKLRSDGQLAADLQTYVDDIRPSGPSEAECWKASQRVSSVLGSLGIQDAPRKRRPPSLEPGAWAGGVVHSSNDEVNVLVTEERWAKTQGIIRRIALDMDSPCGMRYDLLNSDRGFLVYVTRAYPSMTPYLKGIHLTLASWQGERDPISGWKLRTRKRAVDALDPITWEPKFGLVDESNAEAPEHVIPVPRMTEDVRALLELTESPEAPKRPARMKSFAHAIYGFGDASGLGFGSTFLVDGDRIRYRHGTWTITNEHSSNFRELCNLVQSMEDLAGEGVLTGREIFMFTDNSTAERAYFKGTSSAEPLFELVLRMRKLEMVGEFKLHVIHVAGTRMIAQGTDGMSRGDHGSGVMAGLPMISFVPLNLSALERSKELLPWIQSWSQDERPLEVLAPEDWFNYHKSEGCYLWAPPPAAADAAIELMAKSIHKRFDSTHIMIVPRLMTARWRKLLGKATDVMITIPVGTPVWPACEHEPLILAISFPLISHRPWRLRGSRLMDGVVVDLSGMWKDAFDGTRSVLRKFVQRSRTLDSVPSSVVWEMLHGDGG